ncbi:MAG: hypothetical protein AB7F75_12590, partial [Planctomycetota bacterium]
GQVPAGNYVVYSGSVRTLGKVRSGAEIRVHFQPGAPYKVVVRSGERTTLSLGSKFRCIAEAGLSKGAKGEERVTLSSPRLFGAGGELYPEVQIQSVEVKILDGKGRVTRTMPWRSESLTPVVLKQYGTENPELLRPMLESFVADAMRYLDENAANDLFELEIRNYEARNDLTEAEQSDLRMKKVYRDDMRRKFAEVKADIALASQTLASLGSAVGSAPTFELGFDLENSRRFFMPLAINVSDIPKGGCVAVLVDTPLGKSEPHRVEITGQAQGTR